ncbi:membrane protein containing Mechanosensitive ion channel MscS [Candidatus Magnetomorum sp. HK-1]|nr:membrane protein containing Mechanosensitive ion channel MscS [Candidatus Magnetomorum sp. HK-1]
MPLYAKSDDAKIEKIYIAVALPMTGSSAKKGMEVLEGINMYIEKVNNDGGINNKLIELQIFDDQNKTEIAVQNVQQIVDSQALIVLGHRSSNACIAAGKHYKSHRIAAITSTATADLVTQDNNWYFRSIFTNYKQGKFIAYYTKHILKRKNVSVIYIEDEYGKSLLSAFEEYSKKIGLDIDHKWLFTNNFHELNNNLKQNIDNIKHNQDVNTIFLALHDVEAVPVVKYIKDSGLDLLLIGGASIGKQSFAKRFKKYPEESLCPGYYTDGIYATTYFIYDISNQKAQKFRTLFQKKYKKIPGAVAVSSYDIAGIAIDAIKNAGITGKNIKADRQKIRDYLASKKQLNDAFSGTSGYIYFDSQGNAVKSVPMAIFNSQKLISTPIQISQINNLKEISLFKMKNKTCSNENLKDNIVCVDGQLMRKTKVVYTGVKFNSINNLDIKNKVCYLDFYLWFRFSGKLDFEKIHFINANEPVVLNSPIKKKIGKYNYRLFHIQANFKMDFTEKHIDYGKLQLGFMFKHQHLSREHLIFVSDVLSMNFDEKMEQKNLSKLTSGWSIEQLIFFQDTMQENIFGDPDHLHNSNQFVDYSRYNAIAVIHQNAFAMRGAITKDYAWIFLSTSGFFLVLSLCVIFFYKANWLVKYVWFNQVIFSSLFLLSLETIFINFQIQNDYQALPVIKLFDVLWWILPVFFIKIGIERFVWRPIEQKTKQKIPHLMRSSVVFLLYIFAFVGILSFVFEQKLTSLMATSGLVAMIIGFAIQGNISNLFSGIVINLERPFRIGDWIKFDNEREGKVINITWRTTRIITRTNEIICIPNYKASECKITNYHYPNTSCELKLELFLSSDYSIENIEKAILNGVANKEGVKSPQVRFRIGKSFVKYYLFFTIDDYGKKSIILDMVHRSVWKSLNDSNFKLLENPLNYNFEF